MFPPLYNSCFHPRHLCPHLGHGRARAERCQPVRESWLGSRWWREPGDEQQWSPQTCCLWCPWQTPVLGPASHWRACGSEFRGKILHVVMLTVFYSDNLDSSWNSPEEGFVAHSVSEVSQDTQGGLSGQSGSFHMEVMVRGEEGWCAVLVDAPFSPDMAAAVQNTSMTTFTWKVKRKKKAFKTFHIKMLFILIHLTHCFGFCRTAAVGGWSRAHIPSGFGGEVLK